MKNDKKKLQYRINRQIRVPEVRIVGDDIESQVIATRQALQLAEQKGLDLVEISPNAQPPVCRIIDYSKFLYQQKKHQKELKAKQVKIEVKEIRFGPQTDEHDYDFKLKHAKEFLSDGNKVKAYVFFRGRSILFKEQGEVLLLRFANDLEEYGKVEQMPVLEGVEGNEADLRPMILKDIADRTGLDISTISRVSNIKYAQTKWGTFPLRFFFTDAYTTGDGEELSTRKIKIALKELIDNEDKKKPLSDDLLKEELAKKGLPIARRTVAKYREQLGLPVARLRKG